MPIVNKEEQHRPTITGAEVSEVIDRSSRREAILFALLAGTGLRAGEILALKPPDFSDDFRVLHVSRSIWKGREQAPKTPAAIRQIDIPEPLAGVVRAYADGKTGLLFATKSGRPLTQRNVHRAAGHALHAFRDSEQKCCDGLEYPRTSSGCGSVTQERQSPIYTRTA